MNSRRTLAGVGTTAVFAAAVLVGAAIPAAAATGEGFGVTTDNRLARFPLTNPGAAVMTPITGLNDRERILDIDFRPAAPKDLYAVTDQNRVLLIDEDNSSATLVSTLSVPLELSDGNNDGTPDGDLDIDFNPSVDRLRIVTDTTQNLRVNVDTGATIVDGDLNFAAGYPGDPGANGTTPKVTGAAYRPACPGGATELYDTDFNLDDLTEQDPPNDGTLNFVGNLNQDISILQGFDIDDASNAFLAAQVFLDPDTVSEATQVYSVNLDNGQLSPLGSVAGEILRGFAVGIDVNGACNEPVIPEVPMTVLLLVSGAAIIGTAVLRGRRSDARA